MIVPGADTHKSSHTIAAVDTSTGRVLGDKTGRGRCPRVRGAGDPGARSGWPAGVGAGGLSACLGRAGAVTADSERDVRGRMITSVEIAGDKAVAHTRGPSGALDLELHRTERHWLILGA
jgi:hypothetical protein